LASGAEAGAAVLDRNPLDRAAANRAGLASLMSNLRIGVGCAQLALRIIGTAMQFELAFSG